MRRTFASPLLISAISVPDHRHRPTGIAEHRPNFQTARRLLTPPTKTCLKVRKGFRRFFGRGLFGRSRFFGDLDEVQLIWVSPTIFPHGPQLGLTHGTPPVIGALVKGTTIANAVNIWCALLRLALI